MTKPRKRKTSDEGVVRWLEGYRRQRIVLFWLGSIGSLLLSVLVLIATWWLIWLVVLVPATLFLPLKMLSTVTWIGFGLIFVAHLTANRHHLETFKFDEPGPKLVAAQFAAHVAGISSLALFMNGPETMRSQIKMISLILLSGPALIGLSWRLARAALAAQWMDVLSVGAAIAILLTAGKRVLVDDLAARVNSPDPPRLLRELLLINGVVLLTSGDRSLAVTDSLINEISASIEKSAAPRMKHSRRESRSGDSRE